ncbi:MAG: DJ-1/PfpI family protein [Anaerolineae bacterium]|nr:DJ-1/PfpI family protein [Anaerolineae bacterium]
MISAHQLQKNSSAILVSPGFTEKEVVYCLSQMRALGLPILLVGVSTSLVKSQRGLTVAPDLTLSEVANGQCFRMLIIPGSYECVTNLLTSPDFHVQVNRSLAGDGRVAILSAARGALHQIAPFATPSERILYQQDQPLELFCQQLIQIATAF